MLFNRIALFAASCAALVSAGPLNFHAGSSKDQPVSNNWNTKEISQAAGLVQQTYCDRSTTKPGLKIGDSTLLFTAGNGDHRQRFNLYHSESLGIAVAIEGTNLTSITSDLHDVKGLPVLPHPRYRSHYPEGTRVMHGFQEAYVSIMDDMVRAIEKYKKEKNEKRVTIIGHSLGAAMGLLAAMDVELRLDDGICKTYLFGLPRVGNPTSVSYTHLTLPTKA